jgi:hypothetical protein
VGLDVKKNNWRGLKKMTYNYSYTKDDFKNIVVDGMGTAGASVVDWIDLFILLVVLGFIIGTFIKLGKLVRG